MEKRQLFHLKMYGKCQKSTRLNGRMDGRCGHNYRVAALSLLYVIVLGIIIPSLKSIGQF